MHRYLESTEFYHRRYQNFSTLIIIPTLILFIGIIIFISISKIDTTTNTTGKLINNNQVISLVNSNNVNAIKPKQKVYFSIKNNHGNNQSIPGQIISTSKTPTNIIKGFSYYKIKATLKPTNNDKQNFKLGLNGQVTIIQNRKTILKAIINDITSH